MASGFVGGMFALSTELAIAYTVAGVVAAAGGMYVLRAANKVGALRLLTMSVVSLIGAWAFYSKYQDHHSATK